MIYFAQRQSDGLIKIGTTKGLANRMKALRHEIGEPLSILGTCEGSYTAESSIHRILEDHRSHGEWFHPSNELMVFIENLDKFEAPSEISRNIVSTSISKETKEEILGIASVEDRTISEMTSILIEEALEQRQKPKYRGRPTKPKYEVKEPAWVVPSWSVGNDDGEN